MSLTAPQLATLKAAIIADPTAGPLRTAGDSASLLAWCNAASASAAWRAVVPASDIFDAITISSYDNLSAGKRDAVNMMLNRGTIDASKVTIRNGFVDIFTVTGAYTDSAQLGKMVNNALVEFATKAQTIIGGTTPAAVGGVTALKRGYVDLVSQDEANRLVN